MSHNDKGQCRVFVATANDDVVAGIYSLSIRALPPKKGIRYHLDNVPGIYFDNLGVTKKCRGNKLGNTMMVDAFQRTIAISEHVGVHCLWLTAIDDATCEFYQRLGFERTKPKGKSSTDMFISRKDIEAALIP